MRPLVLLLALAACGVASAQPSEAFVEQVGTGNEASLVQTASAAYVLQAGAANRAAVEQGGAGGHLVRLEQTGGSAADVLQTGVGNRLHGLAGPESAALQLDASRLVLEQHGVGNVVRLEQAAGAFAHVVQVGAGNTATVLQN
jgi:hypothetical protein